jgi:hypothetical protein
MNRADVPNGARFRYIMRDGLGPTLYQADGGFDVVAGSDDPGVELGSRWHSGIAVAMGARVQIVEE